MQRWGNAHLISCFCYSHCCYPYFRFSFDFSLYNHFSYFYSYFRCDCFCSYFLIPLSFFIFSYLFAVPFFLFLFLLRKQNVTSHYLNSIKFNSIQFNLTTKYYNLIPITSHKFNRAVFNERDGLFPQSTPDLSVHTNDLAMNMLNSVESPILSRWITNRTLLSFI